MEKTLQLREVRERFAALGLDPQGGSPERFAALLGQTPMQYLASWRMHLAEEMLRERRSSVAQIADRLGYQTEAAFRRAFRRVRGVGPGDVRRRARNGS